MLNKKQQEAIQSMINGDNVFITGGGGVGKSFIIQYFVEMQKNNKVIATTSTTGISAILIGGVTIHSYLGIGLGTRDVDEMIAFIRKCSFYRERWRKINILIIDEISMLSPDLFDKLNIIGQTIRYSTRPFGGIQVIVSGDFCQLPCVKNDKFCFEAQSWNTVISKTFYLTEIVRQKDTEFQHCLNEIRLGNITDDIKKIINKRQHIKFKKVHGIKPTKLYPLNSSVDYINNSEIKKLSGKNGEIYEYQLEYEKTTRKKVNKEKLIKSCIANETLELTDQCQVMLIYNLDFENGLVNGSRGVITRFEDDLPVVKFMNGIEKVIDYHTWEIKEDDKIIANISQIPLKVAYAFSIHKSQGSTIDYAIIDLDNIFEYGMAYVALSRVKSLDGLSITNINWDNICCHPKAIEFYDKLQV